MKTYKIGYRFGNRWVYTICTIPVDQLLLEISRLLEYGYDKVSVSVITKED